MGILTILPSKEAIQSDLLRELPAGPINYLKSPGPSFDKLLKKSGVELEYQLIDRDMTRSTPVSSTNLLELITHTWKSTS